MRFDNYSKEQKQQVYKYRKFFKRILELQHYEVFNDSFRLKSSDKEYLKKVNEFNRIEMIYYNREFIKSKMHFIDKYIANSYEINIGKIKPVLITVENREHKDLFRFINLVFWSMKYSIAPGRRLQYLVMDENNEKIMGIISFKSVNIVLCSHIFKHLKIKLSSIRKIHFLNSIFEGDVLGAIPPYNAFLGSKLIASFCTSNKFIEDYNNKYSEKLLFPMTTGAYNKSSIYNRLKDNFGEIASFIEYTKGTGTTHIPKILKNNIKKFLINFDIKYTKEYNDSIVGGLGPLINLEQFTKTIGFKDALNHGFKRSVYVFNILKNPFECLNNYKIEPIYIDRTLDYVFDYWKKRWGLKRESSMNDKNFFDKNDLKQTINSDIKKSEEQMKEFEEFL